MAWRPAGSSGGPAVALAGGGGRRDDVMGRRACPTRTAGRAGSRAQRADLDSSPRVRGPARTRVCARLGRLPGARGRMLMPERRMAYRHRRRAASRTLGWVRSVDHPRRPRQGRGGLRGAQREHPDRGPARHPDEGHDHALRVVRRGRARPDLRAHPRGPRPGQVLGPEARSARRARWASHGSTARRTRSGASSSWASRRPPSPSSRAYPRPPCTAS